MITNEFLHGDLMKNPTYLFASLLILSQFTFAETSKKATAPAKPVSAAAPEEVTPEEENKIMASLISQVVEEMSKPSFDIEFEGLTFDGNVERPFSVESFTMKAQVAFKDDIKVDFIRHKSGEVEGSKVKKFRTYLYLGTKDLVFDIQGNGSDTAGTFAAKFYVYDPKTKQLNKSFLHSDVKSKITESIFIVDLHSLSFNWKVDPKNTNVTVISGIAVTEKQLWDFRNQRYLPKVAHVAFKGTFAKGKKPVITTSYLNQTGSQVP